MTHVEDLVILNGMTGAQSAIQYLENVFELLKGNSKVKLSLTVKWDGAPAIFAGIDPTDKHFFVAKKSLFNANPILYKSASDIISDENLSSDLAHKMSIAFTQFSSLGIKNIIQGDIMFTYDTVHPKSINGENYITFHPNAIVYAVPADTELAHQISTAQIGVVWHTTYSGSKLDSLQASFGIPIASRLRHNPKVWMQDATYKDYSGMVTFTAAETSKIQELLNNAKALYHSIDSELFGMISTDKNIQTLMLTFGNAVIKTGEHIPNPANYIDAMMKWIQERYQQTIDTKKKEVTKQRISQEASEVLAIFGPNSKYRKDLIDLYTLINALIDLKTILIGKLAFNENMRMFVQTTDGFQLTNPEGVVAIDHLSGNAVKLVNRLVFSKNNFDPNVVKGWSH